MASALPAPIPILPFEPEGMVGVSRTSLQAPRRLVLIRLQAFGDTTGLLPLVGALSERWPACAIEIVTDERSRSLFTARKDVARVHTVDGRASRMQRGLALLRLSRALRREPLDVVVDLQRSPFSRALVRLANPPAWVALDRFAPRNGLTRYVEALDWVGLGPIKPRLAPGLTLAAEQRAREMLGTRGRDEARPLVCLNPAGGWVTKQWPLERWVALGQRLRSERGAQLLTIGEGGLLPRFAALKAALGASLLDFSGETTPDEAMALLAEAEAIVSEDSGLMHLAWTQGVPAVAIFGASRSVWSRPNGPGCSGFYSEDLACGACMQPSCARGDLLCLTRVSVDEVFERVCATLPDVIAERRP
ncbi:MAG: glycosyltransferase family 9 protein [Thermoanaerobaculia bacterium]